MSAPATRASARGPEGPSRGGLPGRLRSGWGAWISLADLSGAPYESVDADGGPRLGDGALRAAVGAVEIPRRLDRRRARHREPRVRWQELRERAVEHPLHLFAVRAAHSL